MESNEFNKSGSLKELKVDIEVTKNRETEINQILTNEQKLEHLTKLIQDAEQNLENGGISKKLVK